MRDKGPTPISAIQLYAGGRPSKAKAASRPAPPPPSRSWGSRSTRARRRSSLRCSCLMARSGRRT
eukprot:4417685-Alexandrium_andersonii.AAC.1